VLKILVTSSALILNVAISKISSLDKFLEAIAVSAF
jgi:hypothetical protein